MNIKEKKSDKATIILEIHIKESDYAESVQLNLLDYRKKMNLPGFRVGKVPMGLVKKKYGLPIKVEEINKLLSSSIQNYISDNKISILGGPMPIDNAIDFENNVNYTFEYELGVQPDIKLSDAEKEKIDYWVIEPKAKQIDSHILSLQKRYGSITNPDSIAEGDMLNVRLDELSDNKTKEGGVSNTTSLLLDKIEDTSIKNKFLKSSKSDSIVFYPKKAFTNKSDLASMLNISKEDLSKIDSKFSCEIQNISRLIPSEMNVDFFKKVYPDKDIKTSKKFKTEVKSELSNMYLKESDRKLCNDASLMFMDTVKVELPKEFLKKWLKSNAKKRVFKIRI